MLHHKTRVLYERQCSQQWYTKWKGAWLFCSQSLHRILCTANIITLSEHCMATCHNAIWLPVKQVDA